MNIRTDLAFEARDFYMETAQEEKIDGLEYEEEKKEDICIKRIKITTDRAAELIKKPQGDYITAQIDHMEYRSDLENIETILSQEISAQISLKEEDSVLVVGLGNQAITADALGPKVLSGLVVSRHLKEQMPELASSLNRVSAVAPGVLGITGIETGEIIGGICEKMHPTYIIAIDALAAGSLERISNTIQISNTGIVPGSGVQNHRNALTRETLGVPVIAIGVPTVVSVGAIVRDSLQTMQEDTVREKKLEEALQDYMNQYEQMVVTPKSIDLIISKVSKIIASALNLALHPALSLSELENFL